MQHRYRLSISICSFLESNFRFFEFYVSISLKLQGKTVHRGAKEMTKKERATQTNRESNKKLGKSKKKKHQTEN